MNASEKIPALLWGEAELTAGCLFIPVKSQTPREQLNAWQVEEQSRDVWA